MSLERLVQAVGWVSLGLAALAFTRPRELAAVAGVAPSGDASLPVLVRLTAARQAVLGLALLTRLPPDVQRSAGLFLPLTALDAVAVGLGVRAGVLLPRAGAMSAGVLAVDLAVLAQRGARRAR